MIIKIVSSGSEVPLFYAPYFIDVSKNYEARCTFIGLNILFYFMVEFRFAVIEMVSTCQDRGRK